MVHQVKPYLDIQCYFSDLVSLFESLDTYNGEPFVLRLLRITPEQYANTNILANQMLIVIGFERNRDQIEKCSHGKSPLAELKVIPLLGLMKMVVCISS